MPTPTQTSQRNENDAYLGIAFGARDKGHIMFLANQPRLLWAKKCVCLQATRVHLSGDTSGKSVANGEKWGLLEKKKNQTNKQKKKHREKVERIAELRTRLST